MSLELRTEVDGHEDTDVHRTRKSRTSQGKMPYRGKPRALRDRVAWLDRWLVNKMVDVVSSPPVRISLWDEEVLELSGQVDLGVREQLQGGTLAELVRMRPGQGHRADLSPEHE